MPACLPAPPLYLRRSKLKVMYGGGDGGGGRRGKVGKRVDYGGIFLLMEEGMWRT
jgi:hypothetical protein